MAVAATTPSRARNIQATVILDRERFDAVDNIARGLGISRSAAFSRLVDLHAGQLLDHIAAQPDEVYEIERWKARRLSRELVSHVAGAVRQGATKADAYRSVEVPPTTGSTWEKRGRDDISADKSSLYADLVASVERARAECNIELIQEARRKGDYRTLLKLLDPEQFNPVSRSQLDVTHRWQMLLDWDLLSIEESRTLATLMRKASPLEDNPAVTKTARPAIEAVPEDILDALDAGEVDEAEWTEAPDLEARALEKPEH